MTVEFVKVTHKLISRNGWCVWLPGKVIKGLVSLDEPDVYAQSSVQLFPLGARLEFADGRLFRYGKFGATSTNVPLARMVANMNAEGAVTGYVADDGFEGNLYAAAAVDAEYVDLWTIIAASGTGIRTTVYAQNFFEDGMLACYPDGHYCEYRIVGSEATVTPYTRCYLEHPLKTALVVGTAAAYVTTGTLTGASGGSGVTAYTSLFSQLKDAVAEGTGFISAMGIFLGPTFTSGYYGWIQRKGRAIVTPTAYFGDTTDERMAQLHSDGTIALKAAHGTQTVGYLTQRTVSGYGDLEIWLTLE